MVAPNTQADANALARASLLLGIVGIITAPVLVGPLIGAAGLVLGIKAWRRIHSYGPPAEGKRLAIAGIATSTLSIAMIAVLGMLLWQTVDRAYAVDDAHRCQYNLGGIYVSMLIYSTEHNNQFPPDPQLLVDAKLITQDMLRCPFARHANYIYPYPNRGGNAPPGTIMLYEPLSNHQHEGIHIAIADHPIRFYLTEEARALLQAQGLALVE